MIAEWTKKWAQKNHLAHLFFPEIDSTNTYCKEEYCPSPNRVLVLTDHQNQGRGRHQNQWLNSKKGDSLLSSWVFPVNSPPQAVSSPIFGLALYTAFQKSFSCKKFSLKAPNDIYLENKKVCGILLEYIQQNNHKNLIVGLGVNVLSAPNAMETAGSIFTTNAPDLNLDKEIWFRFLDCLNQELCLAVELCQYDYLQLETRQQLLTALNLFPMLKEKYTKIDRDASLHTTNKHILWSQL